MSKLFKFFKSLKGKSGTERDEASREKSSALMKDRKRFQDPRHQARSMPIKHDLKMNTRSQKKI